jgi:uncharacterized protein YndB with AHSA1/START domain
MTTLTHTYHILIDAPAEKIFAYVSDLARHSEWSGGPLKVEAASSGPIAVGSRYVSVGDLPMQKDRRNELRVTVLQRPSRFGFTAQDPGLGEVTHEFNFTPQGSATLVARRVTVNAPPLMAFMLQTFVHPLVDKPMMDKSLAALKVRMETAG